MTTDVSAHDQGPRVLATAPNTATKPQSSHRSAAQPVPGAAGVSPVPGQGHIATLVRVGGPEERDFVEKDRKARIQERQEEKQRKSVGLALTHAVEAVQHSPTLALQSVQLGIEAVSLVWEQPDRTAAVARAAWRAALEGTQLAVAERSTLTSAADHARKTMQEVGHVQERAPNNSTAAVEEAKAAVSDLASGVREPSVKKVGTGTVEGAQSAGDVGSAVAQAPDNAFQAVKQAVVGAATAASVPLRSPVRSIKAAWRGTVAAGQAARLTVASPTAVSNAMGALTGAAREVGSAAGIASEAMGRVPGGGVVQGVFMALLLPWLLIPALAGLVFGVSWELGGRVLSYLTSFLGACVSSAAHVVAWRFPATRALPHTHALRELSAAGPPTPSAPITPAIASAALTTDQPTPQQSVRGGQQGSARVDTAPEGLESLLADDLVFGPARDAWMAAKEQADQDARDARAPLRRVGGALAAAGRSTRNVFTRLFRRKGLRGIAAPSTHREDGTTPVGGSATEGGRGDAAVTDGAPSFPGTGTMTSPDAPLRRTDSDSSSEGAAIDTPAGLMLPLLALGMRNGPYSLHGAAGSHYASNGEPRPSPATSLLTPASTPIDRFGSAEEPVAVPGAPTAAGVPVQGGRGYAGDTGGTLIRQGEVEVRPMHGEREAESAARAAARAIEAERTGVSPAVGGNDAAGAGASGGRVSLHDAAEHVAKWSAEGRHGQPVGVSPFTTLYHAATAPFTTTVWAVRTGVSLSAAVYAAVADSGLALYHAAMGSEDPVSTRAHRVGSLIMQLPVLSLALTLAAGDTAVWAFTRLFRRTRASTAQPAVRTRAGDQTAPTITAAPPHTDLREQRHGNRSTSADMAHACTTPLTPSHPLESSSSPPTAASKTQAHPLAMSEAGAPHLARKGAAAEGQREQPVLAGAPAGPLTPRALDNPPSLQTAV